MNESNDQSVPAAMGGASSVSTAASVGLASLHMVGAAPPGIPADETGPHAPVDPPGDLLQALIESESTEATMQTALRDGSEARADATEAQATDSAAPSQPLALEEVVEPLPEAMSSAPLSLGEQVTSFEQGVFTVAGLQKTDAAMHYYTARREPTGEAVWMRQALTSQATAALRREAEVLSHLESPLFLRQYACFEQGGHTFHITEQPPEQTLAGLLAHGPIPLQRLLTILSQVAFALSRLHTAGWVHRAVRPQVIALGKPVKLLDLSYAARVGAQTERAWYFSGYTPREVPAGAPADVRSDVYALGALLFSGVMGRPIGDDGPQLNSWEPPWWAAGVPQLLSRCLGEPASRYPAMDDLHRDLLRLARCYAPSTVHTTAAATSVGLAPSRDTNQDAYLLLTGRMEAEQGAQRWVVACLADGMGGMAAGEVASDVAVRTVAREAARALVGADSISADQQVAWLVEWTQRANARVCDALNSRGARGGATLLCALVVDRRLAIAHVGDCRLYRVHDDAIDLLTRDHSLAMAMVLQGEVAPEQLRHHPDRSKVTRSLGERQPLPSYAVDTLEQVTGSATIDLAPEDILLLCCDGIWEPVLEADICAALHQAGNDLPAAASGLVRLALQGGDDNATAVLVRVDEVQPWGGE